jgi:hypothetical protein
LRRTFPEAELERLLGAKVRNRERLESGGYGRVNAHWRVELDDGRSVFVKQALTAETTDWLRTERRVYENVHGSFLPAYFGAADTLLMIEDLSAAEWPPPWTQERIDLVLASLDELHATEPPGGLPRLAVSGWAAVQENPEPLLSTGVCSREWLAAALPALVQANADAELDGDELLHFDVRSDNLCFRDGVAVLVDWNIASVGNGRFDVAFWLPSLRLEGGPEPWEVLPNAGPLAAAVAGFFAARAGLPPPQGAPTVREFQLRQLEVALPWAARELGQAPP